MPLTPVTPGQPLRIAASDWNAILEATRRTQGARGGRGNPLTYAGGSNVLVKVKNMSGGALPQFSPVALGGSVFTDYSSDDFLQTPCLKAYALTGTKAAWRMGILQQPLNGEDIGLALISGVSTLKTSNESLWRTDVLDAGGGGYSTVHLGTKRLMVMPGAATAITADRRWSYAWTPQRIGSGGEWETYPDAPTDASDGFAKAKNLPDTGNTAGATLQSNGADFNAFPFVTPGTMPAKLKPVRGGPVRELQIFYQADGTPTFWLDAPNVVQEGCSA